MDANQSPDLSLPTPAPAQQGANTGEPKVATAAIPTIPASPSHSPLQDTDDNGSTAVATMADDNDDSTIDQEWVTKAKDIVEQTKGDPFTQSKELNKAKADYLKTRYNKDFKVPEDKAQ